MISHTALPYEELYTCYNSIFSFRIMSKSQCPRIKIRDADRSSASFNTVGMKPLLVMPFSGRFRALEAQIPTFATLPAAVLQLMTDY